MSIYTDAERLTAEALGMPLEEVVRVLQEHTAQCIVVGRARMEARKLAREKAAGKVKTDE